MQSYLNRYFLYSKQSLNRKRLRIQYESPTTGQPTTRHRLNAWRNWQYHKATLHGRNCGADSSAWIAFYEFQIPGEPPKYTRVFNGLQFTEENLKDRNKWVRKHEKTWFTPCRSYSAKMKAITKIWINRRIAEEYDRMMKTIWGLIYWKPSVSKLWEIQSLR